MNHREKEAGWHIMHTAHKTRLAIYSVLTIVCMVAIFAFSSQNAELSQELSDGLLAKLKAFIALLPSLSGQGAKHDIRKYAHIFEFCMLGISSSLLMTELSFDINRRWFRSLPTSLLTSWLFCVFYACTDELHQFFVPGRSAQISDVGVDSAGAFIGCILVLIICLVTAKAKGRGNNE